MGIPAVLALLVFLWAGPLLVFGYVLSSVPAPWGTVLAFVSLFVYFEAMLRLWRAGRRLSAAAGEATAWRPG